MGTRGKSEPEAVAALLAVQDGVLTRQQALSGGLTEGELRTRIRRGLWVPLYPGVYVTHTGEPSLSQREWAAVLDAEPAALAGRSALRAVGLTGGDTGPVQIVVDRHRRVSRRPGVRVRHGEGLDDRVLWHAAPPRSRTEEAVLDVAAAARSEMEAVAVLAEALGARVTTVDRLIAAIGRRARISGRKFLLAVLEDLRSGTCSVLEHRYLVDVERPHGLPTPLRQAPITVGRPGFRDLDYPDYAMVVELDGRAFHDGTYARDRDLERDLDARIDDDRHTFRLGWGQVVVRPCATAIKLGRAFTARGWTGTLRHCPSCPPL